MSHNIHDVASPVQHTHKIPIACSGNALLRVLVCAAATQSKWDRPKRFGIEGIKREHCRLIGPRGWFVLSRYWEEEMQLSRLCETTSMRAGRKRESMDEGENICKSISRFIPAIRWEGREERIATLEETLNIPVRDRLKKRHTIDTDSSSVKPNNLHARRFYQ